MKQCWKPTQSNLQTKQIGSIQLFSLVKNNNKQIQIGGRWVGLQHVWTAPKKTSREWRKNHKRGWVSTKLSALRNGKSATSCRETVSPLILRPASLSRREDDILCRSVKGRQHLCDFLWVLLLPSKESTGCSEINVCILTVVSTEYQFFSIVNRTIMSVLSISQVSMSNVNSKIITE